MRMYQIEVDEEVYNYLKKRAEPFIDTPNSILREKLFEDQNKKNEQKRAAGASDNILPQMPPGTPKALEEILQVIYLVRNFKLSRSAATHKVAAMHRVAPQTVFDKYGRQLNLTAHQFDRLIEEQNLFELKKILKNKFSAHHEVIREYLKQ